MADGTKINVELKMIDEEFKRTLDATNRRIRSMNDEFDRARQGISGSLRSLSAASAIFYGSIGVAAYKAVKAASDLQEQTSKFNTVFGAQQGIAEQWAETLVSGYAMSTREAKQNLAAMQDLLEPMGMNAEAAAEMSFEVVKLAADLGSFNNLPTANVMADIQSALVGNYETTKKYGVVINETRVKEEARLQGLIKGKEELSATQKAQVAYSLILQGSKNAIGDMSRTSDSYANVQKKLNAQLEDLSATLGGSVLPMATEFLKSISDIIAITGQMREAIGNTGVSFKNMTGPLAALIAYNKWALDGLKQFTGYSLTASSSLQQSNKKLEASNKALGESAKNTSESQREAWKKMLEDRAKMDLDYTQKIYVQNNMKKAALDIEYSQAMASARKIGADVFKVKEYYSNALIKLEEENTKEINKRRLEQVNNTFAGLSTIQGLTNELSGLVAMNASNETANIDNRMQKQLDSIGQAYEAEKANIEATIIDKKERDAALKALDEKRARDEKAVTDKAEKEKRKVIRENAKIQKDLAIFETLIGIPKAAFDAFQSLIKIPIVGPILAPIAAVAATAFGVAKLALIKSQPLPAAAAGIYAETPFIGGEAGPEIAFPLSSDRGKAAMRLMAEQMLGALEERYSRKETAASPESTIVRNTEQSSGMQFYRVAPLDKQAYFDEIYHASQDGFLFIAEQAIKRK